VKIKKILNASSAELKVDPQLIQTGKLLSLDNEDEEFIAEYSRAVDSKDVKHVEDIRIGGDKYIGMEVGIRKGDECELERVKVKRRKIDIDGNPVGTYHSNPIMDSSQYEVEYLDDEIGILTANIIAENLLAQVDEEGHRQMLISEIQEHRSISEAISRERGHIIRKNGTRTKVRTTTGWELYVIWKDGSGDWICLKDLKDSY